MSMKTAMRTLAAVAALAMAGPAFAASHQTALTGYTEGEVRKVDKAAGKITLKHGAIANLEMPPMTMVFRVKEPAMLDKVKAGDKVKFKAEKVQGAYTVTEMTPGPGT
jgi:Cu/Ag efflux protein CusF